VAKVSDKVARRYAKALFDACAKDRLDTLRSAFQSLVDLLKRGSVLREALDNPAYPMLQREAALSEVCRRVGASTDGLLERFALEGFRNGRLSFFHRIFELFGELVDEFKKLLVIKVTSAFELPGSERDGVSQNLARQLGAAPSVTFEVDRNLIGGVRIQLGDKLIDGSVAGSLENLRREMSA
jgi:F-type H+-transporting ATPase subunit delta